MRSYLLFVLSACASTQTAPTAFHRAPPVAMASPQLAAAPALVVAAAPRGLVAVPAGTVGSGCPRERHATCLGRHVPAFEIETALVTATEYGACAESGACTPAGRASTANAIVDLTAEQAEQYCAAREMRLPSESEWERAREVGAIRVADDEPAEWLLGWYTFFGEGFQGDSIGVAGIGNHRLIIRMLYGRSYRYGGPANGRSDPPISFRCARGPVPDDPVVMCRWTGRVDCGRGW